MCSKIEPKPLYTSNNISCLDRDKVFVFGSNLSGSHNGGAARLTYEKFGAIWGKGVGLQGKSYAIPTMQGSIEAVKPYVDEFIIFAKQHRDLYFYVTQIGCGIAGFNKEQIAPLFCEATEEKNICLPRSFVDIIKKEKHGKKE